MEENIMNRSEATYFANNQAWLGAFGTGGPGGAQLAPHAGSSGDHIVNQDKVNGDLNLLVAVDSRQTAIGTTTTTTAGAIQDTITTTTSSSSSSSSKMLFGSDIIYQYVNLNLVRKMIPQNIIEFLLICVIVIYLIYYFSQISRPIKLIGNNRSRFVEFIRQNLDDTISRRFSPLIYFWGTNPQTALFGYLQGQTSIDEMPRNKFRRQYIYVSDAQYLTSNVDLSQHYINDKLNSLPTTTAAAAAATTTTRPPPPPSSGTGRSTCMMDDDAAATANTNRKNHLVQLEVASDLAQQKQLVGASLLDQNIRLALQDMMLKNNIKKSANQTLEGEQKRRSLDKQQSNEEPVCSANTEDDRLKQIKELDISSSGSSSDSGVFPGHSSSASSSTASLSDVTELYKCCDKCTCKTRYDTLDGPPKPIMSVSNRQSTTTKLNPLTGLGAHSDLTREQVEYGQCALDWHIESHQHYHKNKLVALISAGMTTGSDKKYVTDTVSTLEKLGYEVCVFIRRGVGGLKLSSIKFFSPAKWKDFEAAVLNVRQQRPGARLVAVGFSFGSIELCRYLSMSGKQSLIDAALLISCPFDPEAGGRNMRKRALNRKIDAYLAHQLGKQLHQAMFASPTAGPPKADANLVCVNLNGASVNLAGLPKIKSLVDFEDNYNRILQNYPTTDAYAADSRLQDHLGQIETPTLCLSSEDDFMAPLKLLPLEQIRTNKNLCMILTKRGGHMAFIDGLVWPKKPYFAQRIIGSYLKAVKASLLASESHNQERRQKSANQIGRPVGSVAAAATAAARATAIADKQSHLIQMFDVK